MISGPSHPHCQSPKVPPLPTVNHPRSLLSPPLIITGPFPPVFNHPRFFLFHCQSPKITCLSTVNHLLSLPSAPIGNHNQSRTSSLSITPRIFPLLITPGPSPFHCQSPRVPSLPIVNHQGHFPHHYQSHFIPILLTSNHPRSLPCSLSIALGLSPPYCQLPLVPPLLTDNYYGSLPSSLSITLGLSPPCFTVNNPFSSLPLTTVIHLGSLLYLYQSPWVPPLFSLVNISGSLPSHFQSLCVLPPLLTVYCSGSLPCTSHCLSPWVPQLPSSLTFKPDPSPFLCQLHMVSFPSLLSINPGPSPPFLTVNHSRFLHSSLSIIPGPSPSQCQSLHVPPLLIVNHSRFLPSPLHCKSRRFALFLTFITPGPSTPIPTLNHPRSIPSPCHSQSSWVPTLFFSLLITPGPSPSQCKSSQDLPLLTLYHPRSFPSTLSITSGSSPSLPTVNHPVPPLLSSMSIIPEPSLLRCQSPWVCFCPSSPLITPCPSIPSQLSITPCSSPLQCQSHWVPPLLTVNHCWDLWSPLLIT